MPIGSPEIQNRKAWRDFSIEEKIEAGLVLFGPEIKSIRMGKVSLREAHVRFENGEAFLIGMSISPYDNRGYTDHHPLRPRKLLLHRREIKRMERKVQEKGLTVVPLKLFFNNRGFVKVLIGLGRGKREYDKRHAIAERQAKRDLKRAMKEAGKK